MLHKYEELCNYNSHNLMILGSITCNIYCPLLYKVPILFMYILLNSVLFGKNLKASYHLHIVNMTNVSKPIFKSILILNRKIMCSGSLMVYMKALMV